MKNLKIRRKLTLGFMILCIFVGIIGFVGTWSMNSLHNAGNRLYNHNLSSINAMGEIQENLQAQRVLLRNFIIFSCDETKIQNNINELKNLEDTMNSLFVTYESAITDEALEGEYYKAKKLYLNEFAVIKENAIKASYISFESSMERLNDPSVAPTTTAILDGFTTSMNNNRQWASEAVNLNDLLYRRTIVTEIVVIVIAILLSLILSFYISSLIGKPLTIMTKYLKNVASTGEMTLRREDEELIAKCSKIKDETGICVSSMAAFVNRILEIGKALETVAQGDLTTNFSLLSDKDTMGLSLQNMINNLNNMFAEVSNATIQVTVGSKQISDGAHILAQGSTQQATAVEQLSSSISEIAKKTKNNAEIADQAAKLADTIVDKAKMGSQQMDEMIVAVNEINQANKNINKVIKVIDDIAFQTNILALNAAVEAARAGEVGKGFVVVAEEVRNLAAKSAESAKDTERLIVNSMEKAELGVRIAGGTAVSLAEILAGINESNQLVGNIAKSSEEQAFSIIQINQGIERVSQVVQQNTAAAEESAATSEELSGQSSMLEKLVAQFKLNEYHQKNTVND